jgi:hypothetical protein
MYAACPARVGRAAGEHIEHIEHIEHMEHMAITPASVLTFAARGASRADVGLTFAATTAA